MGEKLLKVSITSKLGTRVDNQDNHLSTKYEKDDFICACFSVFDGHSGDETSYYAKNNLFKNIISNEKFFSNEDEKIKEAITEGFIETDKELFKELGLEAPGTTVSMLLLRNKKFYACNAGDSRIVLSRNRVAYELSYDHKPYKEKELSRIEKAGGKVLNGRIMGSLAVSRGLGDFIFKSNGKSFLENRFKNEFSLEINGDLVSCIPDIIIENYDENEDHFSLVACDGVWDVLTSQEAVDHVYSLISKDKSITEISEGLVDRALKKGSKDNVSVVLTFYQELEDIKKSEKQKLKETKNEKEKVDEKENKDDENKDEQENEDKSNNKRKLSSQVLIKKLKKDEKELTNKSENINI